VAWRGSKQNMNYYCYGVEMIATAPNAAQVETAARWAASLCRAHGWTAGCIAGHGEVASDRDYSDPGIDMGALRTRVATILKSGSTGEEDMALSKDDKAFIQAAVKAEIGYAHLQGQADLINNAKKQLHYDIGVVQTQNANLAKRVEELEKKLGGAK
jgi:N-acetyl-anhydromuramyl-L-alanine amidase AmpD